MSETIPQPPGLPFVGNINELDPETPINSIINLAQRYGEIFKLSILGQDRVFVSSQRLINEVCDEKRFTKAKSRVIGELRVGLHDGLFTAHPGEHNWEIAHRILTPAFGPLKIKGMFPELHDLASQLVLKWARAGPNESINVSEDFTRLTLDSIGLCAMGIRFNSFYRDGLHPFVKAMTEFLAEAGRRASRPAIQTYFMTGAQRQYDANIKLMQDVAQKLIDERRRNPTNKQDLLNAMLLGTDPKTHERMTDESIMDNMITFLIAGHETTSGMLSFMMYNFIKHPEAFRKAREEVDRVVGKGAVSPEHVSKLPYLEACLRETLRVTPSIPAFGVQMLEDGPEETTLGGGQYRITKDTIVAVNISGLHRDPAVWGDDASEFKPERVLDDNFQALPKNAWKPFGNGRRACIGRPFAWEEAVLALAMLVQNFTFRLVNPSYDLRIYQTLTIKPADLHIYATLREGVDAVTLEKRLVGGSFPSSKDVAPREMAQNTSDLRPMSIFFGSNSGTCECLAQTLASNAAGHGFQASVSPLDAAQGEIPADQPVAIITASYEGQPPDNAAQFVEWLQHAHNLEKVNYAVFGCGHKDWASTYQRIPTLIDETLKSGHAWRMAERGVSDVSRGDVFNDFDTWQDDNLWPAIVKHFGGSDSQKPDAGMLDVTISTSSRASALNAQVQDAMVVEAHSLTAPGIPEKRHIAFKLPSSMTYECGDYMSVLPINNTRTLHRVFKRFSLPWDAYITIAEGSHTKLPTDRSMSVFEILGAHVELNSTATRKNILTLSQFTEDDVLKAKFEILATDGFKTEVSDNQLSVLQIIELNPTLPVPFGVFLSMLPAMRIRQYSISSSPLSDPTTATLTYTVLRTPLDDPNPTFLGVTSTHLSMLQPGTRAQVAIKKSHASFHPPSSASTPLIMVCAGTGLAPFRGFVQHRASQIEAGQADLAPALLFIGCTHDESDTLYKTELQKWEALGAVKVYYAFSREPEKSQECRHAQERVWAEREEVSALFDGGAKVFVCGASRLGEGVKDVAIKIYLENMGKKGETRTIENAEEWFEGLRYERYASDVFA